MRIMKRHYDFPGAVRGKFYRKGAKQRLPIYLDARLQTKLECIARQKGAEVGDLVNRLLKKEIHLL
jgi:hypothetical protein